MVGPVSQSERDSFNRKLKIAITLLVGVSAGLVSFQADATVGMRAGLTVLGLAVGGVLAWYVVPSGPAPARRKRDRPIAARDSPFERVPGTTGTDSGETATDETATGGTDGDETAGPEPGPHRGASGDSQRR